MTGKWFERHQTSFSFYQRRAERYNGLPKNRGADMKYQSAAPNEAAPNRRRRRFFLRPSVVLCANGANAHLKLIPVIDSIVWIASEFLWLNHTNSPKEKQHTHLISYIKEPMYQHNEQSWLISQNQKIIDLLAMLSAWIFSWPAIFSKWPVLNI